MIPPPALDIYEMADGGQWQNKKIALSRLWIKSNMSESITLLISRRNEKALRPSRTYTWEISVMMYPQPSIQTCLNLTGKKTVVVVKWARKDPLKLDDWPNRYLRDLLVHRVSSMFPAWFKGHIFQNNSSCKTTCRSDINRFHSAFHSLRDLACAYKTLVKVAYSFVAGIRSSTVVMGFAVIGCCAEY